MGNGEIAITENHQPLTLIEQTDPAVIIEDATNIANQLADIIKQKKLYKRIGNKDHVYVEGWTTLGALIKVFPVLEYSKRLDREDEIIYESRVIAQTLEGKVVGTGEALCSNKEGNWRGRDEYAIKSMSQTRATSKALRIPLGWIMTLAGYSATPAEEMQEDMLKRTPGRPAPGRKPAAAKKPAKPAQTRASDEDAANDAIDAEYKVKEKPDEPKTLDMTGVDLETLMGINKNLDKWIRTCQEKNEPKTVKQVCSWCEDLLQDKKLTLEEFKQVRKALGHDVK
jgi:hypothetical protein